MHLNTHTLCLKFAQLHAVLIFNTGYLYLTLLHFKGSRPEWWISSMIYSREIPFWLEILDLLQPDQQSVFSFSLSLHKVFLFHHLPPLPSLLSLTQSFSSQQRTQIHEDYFNLFEYCLEAIRAAFHVSLISSPLCKRKGQWFLCCLCPCCYW